MPQKLQLIAKIFTVMVQETAPNDSTLGKLVPLQHGRFYGGVYNGRKFMYSSKMIEEMPLEKLEKFIKKQIGIV